MEKGDEVNRLLTFERIREISGGSWLQEPENGDETLQGGAFDTRQLGSADIFFAWKGENSDGHDYLNMLLNTGIRLIIAERDVPRVGDIAALKVENSQKALQLMAKELVRGFEGKIVTITGSSGKTTTKEWLRHLLEGKREFITNHGSFNNHIGCPITLLNLGSHHELLILEMGTSGLGELELLTSLVPAHISVLLNVGYAHLGKFGSPDNVYRAKSEIFSHQAADAVSIIPFGDDRLASFLPARTYTTFGQGSPDFSWQHIKTDPLNRCQTLSFSSPFGEHAVTVNQLGSFAGDLLSAILAVSYHLGLTWEEIEPRLQSLPQEKGRAVFLKGINDVMILDDTYNANPQSVIGMLKTISSLDAERIIAVVGNLAELEEGMAESSVYILENFPAEITDLVLSGETGEILFPLIQERFPNTRTCFIESPLEIVQYLLPLAGRESVIGVKASRSSHFERIVHGLQGNPFSCNLVRCGKLPMCGTCPSLNEL